MMKKFIIVSILFFLFIQLITIDTQAVVLSNPKDEIKAPFSIKEILRRSCYDCHSNNSVIPWYGNVAPFSWYVRSHINDGRKVLNFSEFNKYNLEKQKDLFDRIERSTIIRMPLPSYVWMHPKAKLTQEERAKLKAWSQSEYQAR